MIYRLILIISTIAFLAVIASIIGNEISRHEKEVECAAEAASAQLVRASHGYVCARLETII